MMVLIWLWVGTGIVLAALAMVCEVWRVVEDVRDAIWLWARRHDQLPSRGRVGQARAMGDDVRDRL
jgi:hypothetical protein